jgi:hypothetical protein
MLSQRIKYYSLKNDRIYVENSNFLICGFLRDNGAGQLDVCNFSNVGTVSGFLYPQEYFLGSYFPSGTVSFPIAKGDFRPNGFLDLSAIQALAASAGQIIVGVYVLLRDGE